LRLGKNTGLIVILKMKNNFSAGFQGFLMGWGFVIAMIIGGLIVFFFLKWYISTIDLKDSIIDVMLR